MSWTDDELDALVREAANANKIAYKDAYWHEMEAMLGKAPARKAIGWWWFSGIAFLALTIGATIVASTTNDYSQLANTQLSVSSENNDDRKMITAANSVETRSKIDRNTNKSKETDLQNGNTSSIQTTQNATNLGAKNSHKTHGSNLAKSTKTNAPKGMIGGKSMLTEAIFGDSESTRTVESSLPSNERESETIDADSKDPSSEITEDQTIAVSPLMLKSWNNSPSNSFNKTQLDIPYLANKRFGFYVGAHGGIGQSYLATENNNAMFQVGLNGGVEFFVKRWTFGTGIGYRQQFVSNLKMHHERHYYTFGLMKVNQDLEYDQLLFADLNLNANYSLGRCELGIQVSPSYMLGARLDYKEKREVIMGNNSTITDVPSRNNQFVSSENFKALSLNLGLNYSYAIRKNTLLQMNLSTRLGGNLLNNSFAGNQRAAPIMLEFGVKKRF